MHTHTHTHTHTKHTSTHAHVTQPPSKTFAPRTVTNFFFRRSSSNRTRDFEVFCIRRSSIASRLPVSPSSTHQRALGEDGVGMRHPHSQNKLLSPAKHTQTHTDTDTHRHTHRHTQTHTPETLSLFDLRTSFRSRIPRPATSFSCEIKAVENGQQKKMTRKQNKKKKKKKKNKDR